MADVKDYIENIYLTQEINCAEAVFRAALMSRNLELEAPYYYMMSGFSGGASTENLCGAILGGIAAIGLLLNKGNEIGFDSSKQASKEFVIAAKECLGSEICHEIKTTWRDEITRCFSAVMEITVKLEQVLQKYGV